MSSVKVKYLLTVDKRMGPTDLDSLLEALDYFNISAEVEEVKGD